jgi:hypothetical protein
MPLRCLSALPEVFEKAERKIARRISVEPCKPNVRLRSGAARNADRLFQDRGAFDDIVRNGCYIVVEDFFFVEVT